jgi:hypothetical protein
MTVSDLDAFRDELEHDLSRLLRPELDLVGAAQIYAVWMSETEIDCWEEIVGATHPRMSSWLRPEIGNRWTGPGPSMLLNDIGIFSLDWWRDGTLMDVAVGVAIHELTHMAVRRDAYFPIQSSAPASGESQPGSRGPAAATDPHRARFDRACVAHDIGVARPVHSPEQHGSGFVRTLFHAAHRMQALNRYTPINSLIDWESAGSTAGGLCGWSYEYSVRDEVRAMEKLPLSEIVNTTPPDNFSELWERDHCRGGN